MPPAASILFPTRRRRDYLAVALASVAAQARERGAEIVVVEDEAADAETERLVASHGARYVALASVAAQARERGAEIVVVEDEAADAETERLAASHGARYLALGGPRGLNVARNAAIDAAGAELLCFLDDDVAAWPGWLGALLHAAAEHPEHEAFGGPIRARLEGTNLHACGREPAPVTTLDLGPHDSEAGLVWGANLALRRAALERVGRFDATRSGPGDEEEWERRLRSAGGRILYVAAAGVDHRRAGADARIGGLSRAAWHRGRHSRRFDESKGTAPGLSRELRTLAGCVWHTARYRCGNGIVLTAQTAGRLREALASDDAARGAVIGQAARDGDRDYLAGRSGTLGRRGLIAGRARDAVADAAALGRTRAIRREARTAPPRRHVLVAGVMRPELAASARAIREELARSRHELELRLGAGAPGLGKWANIRTTLAAHPPDRADWLLLVDDDIALPSGFLDSFLYVAERFGLRLAQPAHAFASHAAWPITRRRPGLIARRTRFVEIGPVTAIHADAFPLLLPLPELEMGWGLDAHWSATAAAAGLPIGIVDATPIRHLRPVAASYPHAQAVAEADRYLAGRSYVTRDQAAEVVTAWPEI